MPADTMIQIGVDVGGTKIEAAALGPDGDYLTRLRANTPGGYSAAIETIRALVAEVESTTGRRGSVGVGAPGSVSPGTDLIRNANTVWMNGRPLRLDLERALKRPVRVANDANCLALSEAVDGAAAGAKVAFAVILGTGCGGGVVVESKLVEGANGFGGEWGHLPLPWQGEGEWPGPPCWCGRRGCLETWVSGPGLSRDHNSRTGQVLQSEAIIRSARDGDTDAVATVERYLDRLARGLAMISDILDPDVFVFGGGLSKAEEIYERLPALISTHVLADSWRARLAPARWGDASGVRGAARLWSLPAWSEQEPA